MAQLAPEGHMIYLLGLKRAQEIYLIDKGADERAEAAVCHGCQVCSLDKQRPSNEQGKMMNEW